MHYQIEAMRHAYVDRNSYLGDPDFVKNPLDRLLDKAYAAKIRAAIDPDKAGVSKDIKPGVAPHEGSNTTHYSIVDKEGNAVSVTYTLNDWFGAKVTAADTGVLLNDEMDDFTAKLGVPNLYGLVQGEANAIAPGKRPLSSMSPTIVTQDGKPVMVIGTPGGSRIITAVLHTILNVIDYGMNVQEAVDAPRFHQQWLPDLTNLEPYAISPDTRKILEGWGHKFGPPQPANHVAAILVGAPSLGGKPVGKNRFYGANDPRRNIDHRRDKERDRLREHQAADHRQAQRLAQLGAGAEAERNRQRAHQRRQRGHHDRPETQDAGLADRVRRRHALVALRVEREVDHHDGVLLHDADQQQDADGGDQRQVLAKQHQGGQRAHRGRGQTGKMVIGWI